MPFLERNPRNVNDEATSSVGVANETTAVTVVAANPDRSFFVIGNESNRTLWIRFRTAASDNLKEGLGLAIGQVFQMDGMSVYTGEISVVAEQGTDKAFGYIEY